MEILGEGGWGVREVRQGQGVPFQIFFSGIPTDQIAVWESAQNETITVVYTAVSPDYLQHYVVNHSVNLTLSFVLQNASGEIYGDGERQKALFSNSSQALRDEEVI